MFLVLKWLDDKNSVASEVLTDAWLVCRREDAWEFSTNTSPYVRIDSKAAVASFNLDSAIEYAGEGARAVEIDGDKIIPYYDRLVNNFVGKYFEASGEDKQDYMDALSLDIADIEFKVNNSIAEKDAYWQGRRDQFEKDYGHCGTYKNSDIENLVVITLLVVMFVFLPFFVIGF